MLIEREGKKVWGYNGKWYDKGGGGNWKGFGT